MATTNDITLAIADGLLTIHPRCARGAPESME